MRKNNKGEQHEEIQRLPEIENGHCQKDRHSHRRGGNQSRTQAASTGCGHVGGGRRAARHIRGVRSRENRHAARMVPPHPQTQGRQDADRLPAGRKARVHARRRKHPSHERTCLRAQHGGNRRRARVAVYHELRADPRRGHPPRRIRGDKP